MLNKIVLKLLRQPRINDFARKIYYSLRSELNQPSTSAGLNIDVPEIGALNARASNLDLERINLLVPALSLEHVFGGIATALDFFEKLRGDYPNARIILTEEPTFSAERNSGYASWKVLSLDSEDQPGLTVVPAGSRFSKSLPISPGDRFVATAWWTARIASSLQDEQSKMFSHAPRKYVYLIQDFEPGFYPWSARYGLADSTYRQPERFIGVINTSILKEFFDRQGYQFTDAVSFEPRLNASLKPKLNSDRKTRKKKVLVYGRPSVERNAFPIIVMALKKWVQTGDADAWEFYSAGEHHESIDLGRGKRLVSHGKLGLSEYADELSETSIGVSLMISPHPSYPPLEMSTFGLRVITNSYQNKNLENLFPNIRTVQSVDPDSIADQLKHLASDLEVGVNDSLMVKHTSKLYTQFLKEGSVFEGVTDYVLDRLR